MLAFGVPGVADATLVPRIIAAVATAISTTMMTRCFHSRRSSRSPQCSRARRAAGARPRGAGAPPAPLGGGGRPPRVDRLAAPLLAVVREHAHDGVSSRDSGPAGVAV